MLIKANISVWVLTGDKQETAIEIGKSCNLIGKHMQIVNLSSDSPQILVETLTKLIFDYNIFSDDIKTIKALKK